MKNKKGFTLVELVIVIAVIAILAGVMIGTFASVINSANKSKALQEWRAAVDAAYLDYVADNNVEPSIVRIGTTNKTIDFVKVSDATATDYTFDLEKEASYDGKKAVYLQLSNEVFLIRTAGGYRVVAGKDNGDNTVTIEVTGIAASDMIAAVNHTVPTPNQ